MYHVLYCCIRDAAGNCWFLAAVASLCASNDKLLHQVVPQDNSLSKDYCGAVHFRVCKILQQTNFGVLLMHHVKSILILKGKR